MKSIDEARLEADLEYRFGYVAEFLGFGPDDADRIHGAAPYLGPLIPRVVESTYEKLLSYDATARHFVPRQAGFDGPTPASTAELSANHAQIRFRKDHLTRYFMQILGRSYDGKMAVYLDMVGKMHTPKAGNSAIDVPLVQMNALMGLLSDVLSATLAEALPYEPADLVATLRSFQKLLWIQNDLIVRHYAR